jgi:hypothetical protein
MYSPLCPSILLSHLATAVTGDMTMDDVHGILQNRNAVPKDSTWRPYYLSTSGVCGRRLSWDDTVSSVGLCALAHLRLRIILPGGSPNNPPSGA